MCEHINIDKPAHKQHKTKKTTKLLNKFFLHIYDPRNIYIYIYNKPRKKKYNTRVSTLSYFKINNHHYYHQIMI